MRRLMEREERLQKKQKEAAAPGSRTPAATGASGWRARRAAAAAGERKPLWQRVRQFLHEVRQELRKVNWPSRDQMVRFTSVTLVTSIILTLVIFALDFGLKELVLKATENIGVGNG
jgi:preprotein translocase subunit SecE